MLVNDEKANLECKPSPRADSLGDWVGVEEGPTESLLAGYTPTTALYQSIRLSFTNLWFLGVYKVLTDILHCLNDDCDGLSINKATVSDTGTRPIGWFFFFGFFLRDEVVQFLRGTISNSRAKAQVNVGIYSRGYSIYFQSSCCLLPSSHDRNR